MKKKQILIIALLVTLAICVSASMQAKADSATINLSVNTGNFGDLVSISGSGFAASSDISATFGGLQLVLSGTTSTDGSGSFFGAEFTVPACMDGGQLVVVSDSSSGSGSASFTVNAQGTQDHVTFAETGLLSDAYGSLVSFTVAGLSGAVSPIDVSGESISVDDGASVSYSFVNPVTSFNGGQQYRLGNVDDPALVASKPISGDCTVTGNYVPQYYLTVQDGGHGSTGGAGWYDANTNAYATMNPLTVAGPTGTQYVFAGWTGDASGSSSPSNAMSMNGPKMATATWTTQYWVNYVATGNANQVIPPTAEWVTSGNSANGSFPAGATVGGVMDTFLGDNRPATITSPTVITGLYQVSYLVGYAASGNAVSVTVSSSEWVISGNHATGVFPSQVTNDADNTRSDFVSDDRPLTITQPTTVIGTYSNQYYLAVSTAYGNPTGQGWYNTGASANAGLTSGTVSGGTGTQYVFTSWGGDASGSVFSSSNSITMNGPLTATASWQTQYQVTFAVVGGGSTSPTGSDVWENSGSLSIAATPSAGYGFSSWSNTGSISFDNANSVNSTATINGPGTITATFALGTYTITVTQTADGAISPGTSSFNYGAMPSFTIIPNTGYHITTITANGASVTVTSPSGQTYQFRPVSAAGSLTATFAVNTYTIAVTQTSNGQIAPITSTVNFGGSQNFTVTPSIGYCIASITVDSGSVTVTSPSGQTVSFNNVEANHSITATYALKNFTLTVCTIGEGSVAPGNGTYPYNTVVNLQATSAVGWNFGGWSNGNTGSTIAVTMASDQTVTANFTQNPQSTPTPAPTQTASTSPTPTNAPTSAPTSTPSPSQTPTNTPSPTAKPPTATSMSTLATMGQYLPVITASAILGAVVIGLVVRKTRGPKIIILK